jgi:iron complex transport system substrate-binding protein
VKRLLPLLLLLGCDAPRAEDPAATRTLVDDDGRSVTVRWPPERIITILPSATELVYAVGGEERLVAVTQYCTYPAAARDKPKVGSIIVDFERVAMMKPDLVLTTRRMTEQASKDLEAAGYPVFSVDPGGFEEVAAALRTVGMLTGSDARAEREAAALLERVGKVKPAKDGPTVYFESSPEPLWAAGMETHPGDVISRAGGRNIFEGGWRQVDWEIVLAADPEVILIAHDDRAGVEKRAGWKALRAVTSGRVHFVTREHFIYATPRLVIGLEEAAKVFGEKNP